MKEAVLQEGRSGQYQSRVLSFNLGLNPGIKDRQEPDPLNECWPERNPFNNDGQDPDLLIYDDRTELGSV